MVGLRALAAYRVAHLLLHEEGPFGIIQWLRAKIDPRQTTWVGRGFNCALCLTFWLALGATFLPDWAVMWLGLAGLLCAARKQWPRLWEQS